MAKSPVSPVNSCPQDTVIWERLKQAISASSGFQRWQLECSFKDQLNGLSLDHQVRRYLRETLAALSY
jgi:hypothetical protein